MVSVKYSKISSRSQPEFSRIRSRT